MTDKERIRALVDAQPNDASLEDILRQISEAVAGGGEVVEETGEPPQEPHWKPALICFLDEMQALPLEGPDDGFSGRDHDEVLHPRNS